MKTSQKKTAFSRLRGILNMVLCLLFFVPSAISQPLDSAAKKSPPLVLSLQLDDEVALPKNIHFKKNHPNDASVDAEMLKMAKALRDAGYLAASVDSIQKKDQLRVAHLHLGERYQWAFLRNGNVPEALLTEAGYRDKSFENKPFKYKEAVKIQQRLLDNALSRGYPFTKVWLDSVAVEGPSISARMYWSQGPLVTFAPMVLAEVGKEKQARISKQYLKHYLGVLPGKPYDEARVRKLMGRLRELPFLEPLRTPQVLFENGKATINLYLKNRRASKFDFLVGLLPGTDAITGKTRLNLTGNANIDLYNLLGNGERLRFEWQQLRPGTQDLKIRLEYPYLLGLPFGVDAGFSLYKRDTAYLDLGWNLGVQYLLEGGNYLKAFAQNASTSLLVVDTARVISSLRLPENLDLGTTFFGLEYSKQKLDYRFNPRKGYAFFVRGAAGFKRIQKNPNILNLTLPGDPAFRFETLYDSLNLRSAQYKLEAHLSYYVPIFARSTLKLAYSGGAILPSNNLYRNELFRIGGAKLLRGFDEESLFASWYNVLTAEWRFLFGPNSYFSLFADGAYLETRITGLPNVRSFPIGFGAGVAIETKVGIFGVSYAMGAREGEPVQFRRAKVHFGYVNLF